MLFLILYKFIFYMDVLCVCGNLFDTVSMKSKFAVEITYYGRNIREIVMEIVNNFKYFDNVISLFSPLATHFKSYIINFHPYLYI